MTRGGASLEPAPSGRPTHDATRHRSVGARFARRESDDAQNKAVCCHPRGSRLGEGGAAARAAPQQVRAERSVLSAEDFKTQENRKAGQVPETAQTARQRGGGRWSPRQRGAASPPGGWGGWGRSQ